MLAKGKSLKPVTATPSVREADHGQVRRLLDPGDQVRELLHGVRIDQVHRSVLEHHPPVRRRELIHAELSSTHR